GTAEERRPRTTNTAAFVGHDPQRQPIGLPVGQNDIHAFLEKDMFSITWPKPAKTREPSTILLIADIRTSKSQDLSPAILPRT
ncbi:MAG TPA: hypothetical protein VFX82_04465, partial [Desulfobacterales bacterium]|nr:hypothetical protein [Desulfobacterales bacterium]